MTATGFRRDMDQLYRRVELVLACVMIIAAGLVLAQWRQHHLMALSVQSNSMRPLLSKGDAVVVSAAKPAQIRVGDIVSYPDPLHPSVIISHRAIQVDQYTGRLVTKGDANASPDPAVSTLSAVGIVRYTLPKAGYLIDALRGWPGLAILVYVPSCLVMAGEVRRLVRSYTTPTYVLYR